MSQRQFRSDDTSNWTYKFGSGSDGALTISSDTTEAPIDSACTGTAASTSLSATNASFAAGQLILIHQTQKASGAGVWELNRIQSYATGTITTSLPLINTYAAKSQVRVIKQYTDVTITSGDTYTAKAWDGTVGGILAFCASGTTTVTGNISASSTGFVGGTASVATYGNQGEASIGAGAANNNAANGGGGGGGKRETGESQNNAMGGGGAGHGAEGTTAAGSGGGVKGGTYDATTGITATLGSGGGSGGGQYDGSNAGGVGGIGGGLVLIISKNLTVTGTVVAGGQAGVGDPHGGGGGGAGGYILMKSQRAILGSALVTAAAGAGGAGGTYGNDGGAGGAGIIHLDYSTSVTGTTTPTLVSSQDFSLADYGGAFLFNVI